MKATARRTTADQYTHSVEIRGHDLTIDEPAEHGGEDLGPSPQELLAASLASCTAITMEMYAKRKGWELDDLEVVVDYTPAERGCPTKFRLNLRIPERCSAEQRQRLQVIAAKCPVHRTLEGEVMFEDTVTVLSSEQHGHEETKPRRDLRRRALSRVGGRAAL